MNSTPSQELLLETAIRFQQAGICTVPASHDGSKRPAVGNWKQLQERMPTVDELRAWWTAPQQGIGVIAGAISGNLECLEIEGRAYDAGMLSQVDSLMHDNGFAELWETIMGGYCERSPSGGFHWFYRISDTPVPSNTKLALDAAGDVLAETRGEGGFMITAPSGGDVHKTGQPYEIVHGDIESIPTITWEQREIIANMFRLFDETGNHSETTYTPPTGQPADSTRAGDDFDARTSWDDLLPTYGWTRGKTRGDGATEWTRPNKNPADGISATTNYTMGGKYPIDRLYVYSSSTPLPTGKFLTKFQVKTLMEFGGDFSAAAKQLRADGYGSNAPALNQFSALPAMPPQVTAQPHDEQVDDIESTDSWSPIDWDRVMDENREQKLPTHLMRTDGVALLYPNSINQIFGESESGKSFTAAYIVAIRIKTFNDMCLIIDYERDENEWRDRLNGFGCTDEQIRTHVIYVRPETTPSNQLTKVLEQPIQLCVIDSVSASLATFGGDTNSNDSITQWTNTLPRRIVKRTGACVIVIDHQAKNPQTRGRFAVGSQAKLATITGAAYEASMTEPLGIGLRGVVTLKLAKDASSGVLKQHVGIEKPQRLFEAANIVFDSISPDDGIKVEVMPPSGMTSNRPTSLMEQTSEILEQHPDGLSQNRLYKALGKSRGNAAIERAWNLLAAENYIREQLGANNSIIRYSVKPYRQVDDAQSDRFTGQQALNAFIPNE